MADAKTEKQKVKEITNKLEEGLKELFESGKDKSYFSTMSKSQLITGIEGQLREIARSEERRVGKECL